MKQLELFPHPVQCQACGIYLYHPVYVVKHDMHSTKQYPFCSKQEGDDYYDTC